MKKVVMIGSLWSVFAAVMVSHVVYADGPRCTTVTECNQFILSLWAQKRVLLAQQNAGSPAPVPSAGVDWPLQAEGGDNSPEHMNQYAAFDRCILRNTDPAVRRAAAWALGYWWDDAHQHGDIHPLASVTLSAMPSGAYYLPTINQLVERRRTNRSEFGSYLYRSSSFHFTDSV